MSILIMWNVFLLYNIWCMDLLCIYLHAFLFYYIFSNWTPGESTFCNWTTQYRYVQYMSVSHILITTIQDNTHDDTHVHYTN